MSLIKATTLPSTPLGSCSARHLLPSRVSSRILKRGEQARGYRWQCGLFATRRCWLEMSADRRGLLTYEGRSRCEGEPFVMTMKYLAVTVCLLLPADVATALTPGDCTRITESGDRLACFYRLFPANKKAGD